MIVKNYTGDRLNFGIASEMAKSEGFKVEMVIVGEDVAIIDQADTITGRRGLAGTLFVHKVAGACASQGRSLLEVKAAALLASQSIGSYAVALTSCNIPGSTNIAKSEDRIGDNEMELGLGIHGEAGRERLPFAPLSDIVTKLCERLTSVMKLKERKVAMMINNLGGSTLMEMYCAARCVVKEMKARGVDCCRLMTGTFMSALDMQGFMITVCTVDNDSSSLLPLLDSPTSAPAWPSDFSTVVDETIITVPAAIGAVGDGGVGPFNLSDNLQKEAIRDALMAILANVNMLNEIDKVVGDGDCGTTFERGARKLLDDIDFYAAETDGANLLKTIGDRIRVSMGGSSGAILDIILHSAAATLKEKKGAWRDAFKTSLEQASFYGGAKVGSRTMLDALIPASIAAATDGSWSDICASAREGMEATKFMAPLAGRSAYLTKEKTDGTPDPGAVAMCLILDALAARFKQ